MKKPAKIEQTLYQMASMVLEEMCFMFPEEYNPAQAAVEEATAVSSLTFTGPFTGKLELQAFGGFLKEMSTNMLGADEVESQQQLDALGEFGNVLAGNLIPALSRVKEDFTISHPEAAVGADGVDEKKADAEVCINCMEGDLNVRLFLDL